MSVRTITLPIDHVGIVGRDLELMIRAFSKLGFYTPGVTSLDIGASDGREFSQNTHFVFGVGYIELIASKGNDHLAHYVQRNEGLHIVAMATDDAGASHHKLQQLGLAPRDILVSTRLAAHGANTGTAKFEWYGFEKQSFPEGFVCVTQHHTPELIYQSYRIAQPNGAIGLAEIIVLVDDVDLTIQRFEQLSFANLVVDRSTSEPTWFQKFTVLDKQGANQKFPGLNTNVQNGFLGLVIHVASLEVVKVILEHSRTPYQTLSATEIWVQPEHAAGCLIVFRTK